MNYNKSQMEAVLHKDGPCLVLAGPGSGKTMVISGRTRTLIEEYGVSPSNILVITFTKAATAEMKNRFYGMMGASLPVRFSTFHSLFFMIIRNAYGYTPEQIVTEEMRYAFLREEITRLSIDIADEKDFMRDAVSEISLVKSEEIDLSHYYSMSCPADTFRQLYRDYGEFLSQKHLIDFDDMMLICRDLFLARPDILAGWQKQFKYILVDEFQDINYMQYELVKMLALPENNLFIVGDDDQSIYRFRGAKPEIMLNFPKDFPDAKRFLLDRNYRSTTRIVEAAGRLISHNKNRFDKALVSAIDGPGSDREQTSVSLANAGMPAFTAYEDRPKEAGAIAAKILGLHNSGMRYSDIAVLFRTNLDAGCMTEKLMEYNIPFTSKDLVPNMYEHFIAKDMLAYMELGAIARKKEAESYDAVLLASVIRSCIVKIMNRPSRYISRESLPDSIALLKAADGCRSPKDFLHKYFVLWKHAFVKEKYWMTERLEDLERNISLLAQMSPFTSIHYIRNVIGYDDFLKSYSDMRNISADELLSLAEDIKEGTRPFETLADLRDHIKQYTADLKSLSSYEGDAVCISTIHSSKGLEYEVVFVPDVNEGVIPYKKALKDEDIEEERRMFYVAMTRAKSELYISFVKKLYNKPLKPSRFIDETKGYKNDEKIV